MRALLVVLALWLAPVLAAVPAAAGGAEDRASIVGVIRHQLDAFGRDDGVTAFSFASPALQAQFGSPDVFMMLVRTQYPAVYRARNITFLDLHEEEGRQVQPVMMDGPDGASHTALYFMERQPDGSWRIGGCLMVKSAGQDT